MGSVTALLLVAPLLLAQCATASTTLYFASGFANHVTMQGSFEIGEAKYDHAGKLLSHRNLTKLNAFMIGYVRVNPSRTHLVFAAQLRDSSGGIDTNVRLYRISLTGTAAPSLLINDSSALLEPCQLHHASPVRCTQVDEFHVYHDDVDNTGLIAFAYRAWDPAGLPAGNQALGLLASDGTVTPLTFNSSATGISDGCPRFVPGSNGTKIIFIRELEDGYKRQMALLEVDSGKVTLLDGPEPDGWGGCPVSYKSSFLYISTGEHPGMESADLPALNVSERFPVPRVNTSTADNALSLQYCDKMSASTSETDRQAVNAIVCKTAQMDDKHGTAIASVDARRGTVDTNFAVPLPWFYNWDLTPNSYHLWLD